MNVGKVGSIGFGKVIKVNAPSDIATRIVDMANGKGKGKADLQVKAIFDDVSKGKAVKFENGDDIFILSGEEGKELHQLDIQLAEAMYRPHAYYGGDSIAATESNEAYEYYYGKMLELVKVAADKQTLDVKYNKNTGKVKSVNLVG